MSPERWERVKELFYEAAELAEGERKAVLDAHCDGDAELRAAVEELLGQNDRAGSFLDTRPEMPAHVFQPGQAIAGRYRIVRLIGHGGMGEVYEAEDSELGGRVALKTIHPDFVRNERALGRLRVEIACTRKIKSPYVCSAFDIEYHQNGGARVAFFTMELLHGETLAERIRREGRMTPAEAQPYIEQMAAGLAAAHAEGVIHRDFKPSNVMMVQGSGGARAVVTDFGLAQLPAIAGTDLTESRPMGTPVYMAPEQIIGCKVTPAADVYALGLVIYEMVTGRRAFAGETPLAAAMKRLNEPPEPPAVFAADLHDNWNTVIMRCLERDPLARFQTTEEVARALRSGERESMLLPPTEALAGVTRRKWMIPAAATAGLTAAGAAGWLWMGPFSASNPLSPEAQSWFEKGTNAMREGVYWKAARAFEKAIDKEPRYALAHARLAEAWNELDSPDKAHDEMLQATGPGMKLAGRDGLYRDAIHLTLNRDFAGAVRKYKEISGSVPEGEKAYSLVDLGRAYEKKAEPGPALQSYRRAAALAPSDPAAYLRLAVLEGNGGKPKEAEAAFGRAEDLYGTESDLEGQAEVEYQRGRMWNSMQKPAEARTHLLKALTLAKAGGSIYQEIRTRLHLSIADYLDSRPEDAKRSATEAIELANRNGIDVLVCRGLIDLGTALFRSRDYPKAEEYYKQALVTARRYHAAYQENTAGLNLGSLYVYRHREGEGLPLVEAAKVYFEKNGYRNQSSSAYALLGRVKRDRGEFGEALREFRQLAAQGGTPAQVATAREGAGSVLLQQGNYPAAMEDLSAALRLRQELGAKAAIGYAAYNLGMALANAGRFEEAESMLALAEGNAEGNAELGNDLSLGRADVFLMQCKYADSERLCRKVISASGAESDPDAKRILGLARAGLGDSTTGERLCGEADRAAASGNQATRVEARLAWIAAAVRAGDVVGALEKVENLDPELERSGQSSTRWRCLGYGATAARVTREGAKSDDLAARAAGVLAEIKKGWGEKAFNRYVARPDLANEQRALIGDYERRIDKKRL